MHDFDVTLHRGQRGRGELALITWERFLSVLKLSVLINRGLETCVQGYLYIVQLYHPPPPIPPY